MAEKLVIIGAGMASGKLLEGLCELAPDAYDITLFGDEPFGNYNRIMLSLVLAGDISFEEIITHDSAWYSQCKINCRFDEVEISIDRVKKPYSQVREVLLMTN